MNSLEEEENDDYGVTSINSSFYQSTSLLPSTFIDNNFTIDSREENIREEQEHDHEEDDEEDEIGQASIDLSTTPQSTPSIHSSLEAFLKSQSISNLSTPSSPTSHSSRLESGGISSSSNKSDKSESGTTTTGSNHSGGGEGSQSGEGERGGGRSELVMPYLDLGRRGVEVKESREKESTTRLLIFGSNDRTRRRLGTLLSNGSNSSRNRGSESDLAASSASFLTNTYSDSSNASTGGRYVSEDLGSLIELSSGTSTSTFFSTTKESTSASLFEQLLIPLEQTEALLNPCYPSTERLAEFVMKGGDSNHGSVDACLVLFSSPPTASEIITARTLSKLVPIFVLLLLPPSPSSTRKPQKTEILAQAVHTQLTNSGVHYTAAFESGLPTSSSTRPFYCLPNDIFDDDFFSETSSLSSSQELLPSPTTSTFNNNSSINNNSTSSPLCHQASHYRDLNRLRSLVSTPAARDRIKRIKVLSFLEWREIHLAARGIRQVPLTKLWGEIGVELLESNLEKDLEFSKRVAERRIEIEKSQKELKGVEDLFNKKEEDYLHHLHHHEFIGMSTSTLGPSSNQFPPLPIGASEYYETKNYLDQSSSYFPPSASTAKSNLNSSTFMYPTPSSVDPFHIPSLLQLVGLNLRLSLLPLPTNSNYGTSNGGGVRNGNLVVMWSVVSFAFALGIFCGKGSSLIWRD